MNKNKNIMNKIDEHTFQIAFNNITIMGMNKINEHKNIELEQNNNIINKIDEQEQEHHEQDRWTQI